MNIATTTSRRTLLEKIKTIVRQHENGDDEDYQGSCCREFEKWCLIHQLLRLCPFSISERLPRSEQWRRAHNHVRDISDREFLDWILLQVEVAANIERGIREMRPRTPGPCYPQILNYARQRMVKAEKILAFACDGGRDGIFAVDANWHNKTTQILKKSGRKNTPYDHGGHEDVPWPVKK